MTTIPPIIPSYLTTEQEKQLLRPLDQSRVKSRQGNSYIEAWDVRRWLNRIFGFGRWSFDVKDLRHIETITHQGEKPRWTCAWALTGRLTVYAYDGTELGHWEDVAVGDATNQPALGDAHDLAVKAAASGALKRCAVNLGDQFGLSLYNDGSTDPTVNRTLNHAGVGEDEQIHQATEAAEPVELHVEPDPEVPSEEQAVEPDPMDDVEVFTRALDSLAKMPNRSERIMRVTETSLAIGKKKLQTAMTSKGVTLSVLIDRAMKGSE